MNRWVVMCAAVLLAGTASVSSAQVSYVTQTLSIDVAAGIRLTQEADLAYDPNVLGNGDGFFTSVDASIHNTQAASWRLDGSDGVTVVYEFVIPTALVHETDPQYAIPISTTETSAGATCATASQTWDPALTASVPCDLTGLTMPITDAVTLDQVWLDMALAESPGLYEGVIELTATVQ